MKKLAQNHNMETIPLSISGIGQFFNYSYTFQTCISKLCSCDHLKARRKMGGLCHEEMCDKRSVMK